MRAIRDSLSGSYAGSYASSIRHHKPKASSIRSRSPKQARDCRNRGQKSRNKKALSPVKTLFNPQGGKALGLPGRMIGGEIGSVAELVKMGDDGKPPAWALGGGATLTVPMHGVDEMPPKLKAWLRTLAIGPGTEAKLLHFMTSKKLDMRAPEDLRACVPADLAAMALLVPPDGRAAFNAAVNAVLHPADESQKGAGAQKRKG